MWTAAPLQLVADAFLCGRRVEVDRSSSDLSDVDGKRRKFNFLPRGRALFGRRACATASSYRLAGKPGLPASDRLVAYVRSDISFDAATSTSRCR